MFSTKSMLFLLSLAIGGTIVANALPDRTATGRPTESPANGIRTTRVSVTASGLRGDFARTDRYPPPSPAISAPKALDIPTGFGFEAFRIYPLADGLAESIATGDFDGDGRGDLALTTTVTSQGTDGLKVFLYLQGADGELLPPIKVPYLGETAQATGLAVGNIDNDGIVDIVVGHDRGITLLRGDRDRNFQPVLFPGWFHAGDIGILDFNADGRVDVIAQSWSSGAAVYLGDGRGGFGQPRPFATSAFGYNDLETGDVTGDGLPDIVLTQGQGFAYFWVYPNNRFTGISQPVQYTLDPLRSRPWSNAIGDFDNDGRNDVALSIPENRPTSTVNLYTQDAQGRLQLARLLPSHDIVEPLVAVDLDNNGLSDLVTAHGGWNRIGIYLQDVSGLRSEVLFETPLTFTSHYESNGLAVGDVSGDGCPDVAYADSISGMVVFRGKNCHPRRTRMTSGPLPPNLLQPARGAFRASPADAASRTASRREVVGHPSSRRR